MRSRVCGSARAAWRAVITARFINSSVTGFAPFMAIPSTLPVAAVAARQLTGSMRNCWTRRFAAGTAAGTTPPAVPLHSCSVRASTLRTASPSPAPSSPESTEAFGERFQLCFAARNRYQLCFANLVGSLLDAPLRAIARAAERGVSLLPSRLDRTCFQLRERAANASLAAALIMLKKASRHWSGAARGLTIGCIGSPTSG